MATGSFRKEDSWMSSPAFHWERCRLGREEISLPESWLDEEVFDNVLNLNTWYNVLTDDHRKHLKKFLPRFPDNDTEEKEKTIRELFSGKDFKFENPLHKFHWKFRGGWFSPDIVTYAALLKKAKHRDYMYQQRRYYAKLVQQILVSRKNLLGDLCKIPPDQPMKRPVIPSFDLEKTTSLEQRANRRYYKILQEVRADCGFDESSSSDENLSTRSRKKQKKQANINDGDDSSEELRVFSTFAPKPVVNGIENGEIKKRTSTRSPFETREHSYKRMLKRYKRRKAENKDGPEFDFGNITLQDIISRANINKLFPCKGENNNSPAKKKFKDKHEKKKKHKPMADLNCSPSQSDFASHDIAIKEEPLDEEDVISAKEAVALSTGSNSPKNVKCSSFFSLLRDFICESSDQKIHVAKLEEKVKAWQESPDASNFDWFSAHPNWSELVLLALKFLAGDLVGIQPDEFVPYLDYKEKQQQWQWLGLGRDSDQDLLPLYKHWLENKDEISLEALESSQGSPPPPRVRTDWIVRATTDEEKQHYSEKEHERYQNPHKAFTFRMHSYEAVVGPVKGVYSKDSAMNKAREHSLLIPDRPSFVTILSLVRDAAARLPNGEGTRADICELLKDSQYLAPATDAQINTVVSGALDRLHCERDPCVKYDVCRKLWIYLHRNRTEEEFERIHQAQGAAAKAKKAIQKAKTSKLPKTKEPGKDPVKDLRPPSSLSNASTDSNLSIATTSSAAATTKTTHTSPKMVTAKIARSTSMPQAVQDSFVHPQQASPKQVGTIVSHVQSSAKALATNLNQIQQSSPVHVPEATTPPLATSKANLIMARSPSTGHSQPSHFNKTPMKPGVWTSVDSQINTSPQINPKLGSPYMQLTQKPMQSVQKPMQSVQKLMQTAQKTIQSAQKPMQSAQKPLQLTQKPIQMGQKPMQLAQKSIQMSQKPMQLSQKPMQTAQKPMQPGQKPMQSIQKPMQSIQKPIQAGQFLSKSLPVIGQPQTVSVTAANIITSSGVKLVSAGPNQPRMVTTHQAPLVAKSVGGSSIPPGAQAHMQSLQTILIKQEQNSAVSKPGSPKPGGTTSSKPVVARIISSPQVVNVSSLIANTIAAQQKQGSSVPGTTTIKIQGGNIIRSIGGKPTQMSVIHTPQGSTGIPTFTLVTQPSGGTVMPPNTIYTPAKIVTPTQMGVLASPTGLQPSGHMTVVSKSAVISTQSGLKIVSGAPPGMKISQLTTTLPQNVMMAKPATSMPQAVTVVAATAKPGTTTVTLATPTSSPTIFTTQGLLKTPQTVVMATPVNTSPVVMAAQPCRPGTAGTNVTGAPAISVSQANTGQASSVSLKTVQGVKVIPVTQASTRGKSQPVFARIITPPTGIGVPLRPPNQGISVIQSIGRLQTPTIMSGQHATILQMSTPQASDDSKSQADKDAS